MCSANFAMGLTQFIRSVQALQQMEEAGADIYAISMGAITNQQWAWLKHIAKLFLILGITANVYLLTEALQIGDEWKITSSALGLASSLCFFIGIPELAAGPLAPIGGSWCLLGYSLIALQFAIDNRQYFKKKFDQACDIGAEAWQDILTAASDYDEVLESSTQSLHYLNLVRKKQGLSELKPEALLSGLSSLGLNTPLQENAILGEDQYLNFFVFKLYIQIQNEYFHLLAKNNVLSPQDYESILNSIFIAYLNLAFSPKAQAALLVLLAPVILENTKFSTSLSTTASGIALKKFLEENSYVNEFKSIIWGVDSSLFEVSRKTKLRTQALEQTQAWANEQVNVYLTDYWTVAQIETAGNQYLNYWNQQYRRSGLDVNLSFRSMILEMKLFGVDQYDSDWQGEQDSSSMRLMHSVSRIYRRVVDENKAPNEAERLDILSEIYNTWHETLKPNSKSQVVFLILLEPVIFQAPRYKAMLEKTNWGRSLLQSFMSSEALIFKNQLGLNQPRFIDYLSSTKTALNFFGQPNFSFDRPATYKPSPITQDQWDTLLNSPTPLQEVPWKAEDTQELQNALTALSLHP